MVPAVVPDGLRALLVLIVAEEQAAGQLIAARLDADLAVDAVGDGVAVRVDQVDAVAGDGLAHGAGLHEIAGQVADAERHLGLAVALGDLQAGSFAELIEDLGVERLAGRRRVLDGRKIVLRQILLDEHAVHRGRRAERGDVILGEHGQDLRGVEAVKVVGEDRAFAQPLAVELAPERLAPAGLGDREVQAVGLDPVPVLGGHKVAERVFVAVHGDLRIAGRAGGEEHEHGIFAAGGVCLADVAAGEELVLVVKAVPALARAVGDDLRDGQARLLERQVDLMGSVAVGGTDDGAHAGRLEAVGKVVRKQLVGRRDGDGAELVQAEDGEPELIVPLQDQHDAVAALDAEGGEVVGRLARAVLHVLEGEAALGHVVRHVQHGKLVRAPSGDAVDDVEGKVEFVLMRKMELLETAVLVLHRLDEVRTQKLLGLDLLDGPGTDDDGLLLLRARHDHGEEGAVGAVDGDHAVGRGALVEDAVALVERLLVVADAHAHRALEHKIKFLAAVGGGVDGLMLQLLGILIGDPVGRGQLLAEQRCHVADGDAVFGGGDEAAAPACDAVARKLGRLALKQIGQLEAEGQRTLVQEGERQIDRAGLVASVFRFRHASLFSHLLFGEAGDAAHLADTERDLHQGAYGGGRCCLGRHGGFLLQK